MAKWFFPSTFLLFLGNWIGQIALNWYAYQLNENPMDLALINFFRLAPIFILSLWAGSIADRYRRSTLIKMTVTSSMVITGTLTVCVLFMNDIPMLYLYIYACLRGCMSAIETPVRQAVLPDISERLSVSKAVSYHSFLLNVCRSIGPAVAGFIIAVYDVPIAFVVQTICYALALVSSLPLKLAVVKPVKNKQFSIAVAMQYFKLHLQGRRIFMTSLLIMAMGYSYTTMLPILTDEVYPNSASVFGTAMTVSAIGGILATLTIPYVLQKFSTDNCYYLSSILFGIALLLLYPLGEIGLFLMIFFVGLFGQFARTTNRIYFQNDVEQESRGKILSVIMMDRGMIPLGAMLLSYFTELIGITTTFLVMGGATTIIAILGFLTNFKMNGGKTVHDTHA
ncbi:MFS transporter [Staphylococcus pseudintermedius]|uniref:MFS transporter n=1 Tax=Staphylococcus pseudintermedius TaxID=283734 RepID=A0A7T7NZ02_STAPS|nr:MFS transporter [Staphylococcus pseudintermedius]ADX75965.1 transporter, major facilitator family [Staphylococcus pseudintermedius ED99]ANQ81188.1 multidrug MFS transporter [Staphylococcus pseudintermedius]ASQ50001.1 multidrug MFS transporter [Staphylococcus pseudintermedius]EGQ0288625.1 MFS transporter [Staphylococcus pseudintermedius]EGQ0300041.1 MFS transporter [Staphylococcus pseudintermedius]